jgi:hypothetical protein
MQNDEPKQKPDKAASGCALTVLVVNAALIGVLTASFTQGPYSSPEQELWYRYGSLGFFIAGVTVPAIVLFAGRKSRVVVGASVAWMSATLVAFLYYATMSGGGV